MVEFSCYVGHIISRDCVEVDPKKTNAVENSTRPLTQTYMRSFLGLAAYYKRLVDGFWPIASPLTALTQKTVKFDWLDACEKGFLET